jgi:hypothetical protein
MCAWRSIAILAEQPMHGYQIIQQIEERSAGWKPSPGSVYPTLQLLTDEGVVDVEEEGGRKTYSLTEAGRAEAADKPAPWRAGEGTTPAARAERLRAPTDPDSVPDEVRRQPRPGGDAGRPHRDSCTGPAGDRDPRRRASASVRDPRRGRMPPGDAATSPAVPSRARYNRIIRFATAVMFQAWWFEIALPRIGLAASRSARVRGGFSGSPRASACSPSTSAVS